MRYVSCIEMATRRNMKSYIVRVEFVEFILLSIMLIETCAAGQSFQLIDRHNYGIVLAKKGELHVATASAKLLFHFEIPPRVRPAEEQINCSIHSVARDKIACQAMTPLLQAMQSLELQVFRHLEDRLNHIYDALFDFATVSTAKRGIFSSILSKITGLADQDDVNRIADLLRNVERGVKRAADAWQSGTSHFMAAIKLDKTRLDNVYALLAMQRRSLLQFQYQFIDVYRQANVRSTLIAKISDLLATAMFQISETDDLFNAIQLLSTNRLPHFFVSHATLQRSLNYLRWYLNNTRPELTILKQDVKYYFQQAKFHVFRHNRHLIINIHVPLTLHELTHPLEVFEVQRIPLLSPNSLDHYTMLTTDFDAIAFYRDVDYYLTAPKLSDLTMDILDLRFSSINLRRRSIPTCALQLIEGGLDDIKNYCAYHIVHAPIPRGIYRLTEKDFLFCNITKITIRCKDKDNEHSFVPEHVQTVYEQHCDCQINADEFFLPQTSLQCKDTTNITLDFTPKFLINLPLISGFLEREVLKPLRDHTFLNKSIPVILPQLPIASAAYQAKLAVEKHSRYELETIINQTKEDSTVYRDLSHYLYNNLLTSHTHDDSFDVFNLFHWGYLLASLGGILGLVLAVFLHCRVRTLFILLARTGNIKAFEHKGNERTLPTLLYPKTSTLSTVTTPDSFRFYRTLQQLFPVELTLLLCVILLIVGFIGYLYYNYRKKRQARTTLIIELSDIKKKFIWKLHNLSLNPGNYRFIVNQQAVSIKLTQLFLSGILSWGNCVTIQNKALSLNIPIKSQVIVYPWEITKLRMLLMGEFYLVIYVNDVDNDVVETVVIKTMHIDDQVAVGEKRNIADKHQILYPVLDNYRM